MSTRTIKMNVSDTELYKVFFEGQGEIERISAVSELIQLTNSAFAHYTVTRSFANRSEEKKLAVALVNESVLALNLQFLSNIYGHVDGWPEIEIPSRIHDCMDRLEELTESISIVTQAFTQYLNNIYQDDSNDDEEDRNCFLLLDFFTCVFVYSMTNNTAFLKELNRDNCPVASVNLFADSTVPQANKTDCSSAE